VIILYFFNTKTALQQAQNQAAAQQIFTIPVPASLTGSQQVRI